MKRGISLAELIVTLGLLSVCLAIVATLFRAAVQQQLHSERKDSETRAGLAACQQLRQDLESAVEITSPLSGGTSSTVALTRINPFDQNLNEPPLLDSSMQWNPHPSSRKWDISDVFTPATGKLQRTVLPEGGTAQVSIVAEGLTDLQCTLVNDLSGWPISAQVRASTGQGAKVRRVVLEFLLHVPRAVVP